MYFFSTQAIELATKLAKTADFLPMKSILPSLMTEEGVCREKGDHGSDCKFRFGGEILN